MPGEGRGLSSRPTQDAVRDREIGQPSNSEKCSEAADGVTRKSEGGNRLSLLRSVRQDQPRRHSGACRIASPEMFPEAEMLPHLICSRPMFIGGANDEADQHGGA